MSGGSGETQAQKTRHRAGFFSIFGGYALIRTGDPIIMSDVL